MSSSDNIKKISIQNAAGSYDTRDVAMEAQNADVSFTGGGQIIEDITEPSVVIASVKSLAKTVKNINTDLSNKANISDLSEKADLDSETGLVDTDQLPDDIDDIIEGYYKESDGKFYKNYNSSTQTYSDEITGQTGKIYVDKLTNGMFRWAGSPLNQFVKIVNLSDMDLDDISNVDISTVQDGESLVYDSVRGKWVNKMQTVHFVPVPTVTGNTYTYNGSSQGPDIEKSADFDTYVTTTGATAVNAGSYTLTFSLKNPDVDMWSDLTTANKTYNYTINKANGSVVLASNAVTLDDDHTVVSVNITSTTGTISASSSATGIATVTATNSAVTITATEEGGTAIITVTAAASTNYTAASASIAVTAIFVVIKSFSLATDAELKDMLDAYYADKVSLAKLGWHVGDTRVMHFNEMDAPSPQASGSKWAAQDIIIEIVATEHTDLATPINGHNKACITVQTREVMNNNTSNANQNGHIYVNGDNSGPYMTFTKWSNLYMRRYLRVTVWGAIPSGDFKDCIKETHHYRHTNYNTADDELVTDTLFLPSYPEVFGTASDDWYIPTTHTEGTQFEWYQTQANRVKQGNNNGNKNGANQQWWGSSASSLYDYFMGYNWGSVYIDGVFTGAANGYNAYGLAPAFAM